MTDNLRIKGLDPKEQSLDRRFKTRGKRKKPFGIETRTLHDRPRKYSVFHTLKLHEWYVFSKYETQSRRDQAYAALVRKAENNQFRIRWGIRQEFRKVDYDGA